MRGISAPTLVKTFIVLFFLFWSSYSENYQKIKEKEKNPKNYFGGVLVVVVMQPAQGEVAAIAVEEIRPSKYCLELS